MPVLRGPFETLLNIAELKKEGKVDTAHEPPFGT